MENQICKLAEINSLENKKDYEMKKLYEEIIS